MKKERKKMREYMGWLLPFVVGAVIGLAAVIIVPDDGGITGQWIMDLGIISLIVYLVFYLHIIVHELGHLAAGRLSGYTVTSFRVGNVMLMKSKGKWQLKRYTLPGTGGQCLMRPPSGEAYDYPYRLYNASGVIGNLILSVVGGLLGIVIPLGGWFQILCSLIVIVGIFLALTNGIPMKLGGIPNDGHNMKDLGKSRMVRHAFWLQLEVAARLADGEGIEDMPSDYFELPEDADLTEPFVCWVAINECVYLHSKGIFEEARVKSQYLIDNVPSMLKIYRNELECELLFYELIDECREEEIERHYTKDIQKYIKMTASFISKKRLLYAYYLLGKKNKQLAEKERIAFEKVAKTYPYQGEIENERKLMKVISKIHEHKVKE